MKEFWDERYSTTEYAYGTTPNSFFVDQIAPLEPGKILLPAEGEGRNAVHAANHGWEVHACDFSLEGRKKALKLAQLNKADITYHVGDFGSLTFDHNYFHAAALIFAHFPSELRAEYHQKVVDCLRPGGILFLEGFSKNHLKHSSENPKAGGPKNEAMLFSEEELRSDFKDVDIVKLYETEVDLNEGQYHVGKASVIRMIARKFGK